MAEKRKKHKLGFANGSIIEYPDGTAGYVPNMSFSQAFRVNIADVTGFSVTKGGKVLERQVNVLGNGTLLGTASVPHGTAEVIERWFRAHPDFGKAAPQHRIVDGRATVSVADEIQKLATLHEAGTLTDEEFATAKQRLVSGT